MNWAIFLRPMSVDLRKLEIKLFRRPRKQQHNNIYIGCRHHKVRSQIAKAKYKAPYTINSKPIFNELS